MYLGEAKRSGAPSPCSLSVFRVQPSSEGQPARSREGERAGCCAAPQHPPPVHSGAQHEGRQVHCVPGYRSLWPPSSDLPR